MNSKSKDVISVELDKKNGCTRYIAGVMKGVKVGPSPQWLADYLKSVGQKSINNLDSQCLITSIANDYGYNNLFLRYSISSVAS